MESELTDLIHRLGSVKSSRTSIIKWGSPILSFGNIKESKTATLGLNPSNREFVDLNGKELSGTERRFHSLKSLSLNKWSNVSDKEIKLILEFSNNYFIRNPYDSWFKPLDYIISGTKTSYYFPTLGACHLDLIPYATMNKWSELPNIEKKALFDLSKDTLGLLLRNSPIELLILNGQAVVDNFQKTSNVQFKKNIMPDWELPRESTGVKGYSYSGKVNNVFGITLKRKINVLGFNHNIQSSFGVTTQVLKSIRNWITQSYIN